MFRGGLGNVVLAPVSEVLARILVLITETVLAAKDVLIEKESFTELANYLQKIRPILAELQDRNVRDTSSMRLALESLDREMKTAQELIKTCSTKSRIYLLINCRIFVKQVQDVTREIGRCLSLLPMASMNISAETRDTTEKLLEDMQNAQFVAAVTEEAIVQKIETGIKERQVDSNFANELLMQIARAVGVPVDPSSLRQELEKFKKEKEEAELRKSQAEAMQLEQIVGLLKHADAAMSPRDKVLEYQRRRSTGGIQPFQPFYCPISREVMEDPVEIASGQTFERSEIEKWFAAGNRTCPTTKVELETLELKPNISLRHSIEEWKIRNTVSSIHAVGPKLRSDNTEEIQNALSELYDLNDQNSIHGYWIAEEGLIPVLVDLLNSGQRVIRAKTLSTLCGLAANNEDNRDKIAAAGGIPLIVRSLARDVGEGRQAVALLLALSKNPEICETIGKVQGCILLLVTMLNSENKNAIEDAKLLLNNVSYNDQNVVQMAEANHFKPLALRLSKGSDMTKILMASALSRMGLTDQSKEALAHEGVIGPLVKMISAGKLEAKCAALGALKSLSTLSDNREYMINAGVIPALLQLLFSVTSVVMSLKEHAAATLANLAIASSGEKKLEAQSNVLESEETIFQLLSLLNLTGPAIQSHLLRALNGIASRPGATEVRAKLREGGAFQLLLPFCDLNDSDVRINAVKLLFYLSQDGAGNLVLEHLSPPYVMTLTKLMSVSSHEEERAAVVGIFGNLPRADRRVTDLLTQANALPEIAELISSAGAQSSTSEVRNSLLENGTSALLHFTSPSDLSLQCVAAKNDVIETLVHLLSAGPPLAKARAAMALGQFSLNSVILSYPITKSRGCWCFNSPEVGCELHKGHCSVKGSFCLLQAKAIHPLVQTLQDKDVTAHEAALEALSTLLNDDTWQNGVKVIADAEGIRPIVRLLSVGTDKTKEKAVWMLEKFFRVERYKLEFESSAQMPLIELTQQGTSTTKSLAARILAHLHILHNQSSYF
ncbi:hypothetical protein O6H91_12G041200 [Diphasiastrum complanatum]|uniref:Uncharacterized protein n=11 Tax=Diphasiastrum complanatum TaxID=34168 RepID=A0ACC2C1X6_DIPCM|nr:hypothetical protein O6H91_12G041200 [Diphasiastrum complanatum]KAJ7535632.1 hypothetical protein O6H91_12G041200 [Diphasiastrum complanatum]KAJ7535633.1 hypothetical protein O6H91_12G041200 [Diphasiastrum complanatum]KAJ7535634.1 hypothetical protein O6H91_12G041200 [Diphasiastrum complanatum]KAJ7535635.1 hypothetical protein O6H91_12G041200 [Diphasiastrum complanatum]